MLARALLLLVAAGLWLGGLWWHGPRWPFELVLRTPAPLTAPAAPAAPRWLRAEVTRTLSGTRLALGDAVQFDRYGMVAAEAGTVHCAPWYPWSRWPVTVTVLGGAQPYAGVVSLDLVVPDTRQCGDGAEPLVSPYARPDAR